MRRRKFENILLVSEMLQKEVSGLTEFDSLSVANVIDLVKGCLSKINETATTLDKFKSLLNEYSVSVYPEAAAGLTFLVRTKHLEPGHYIALDIGGGSSDLSFFYVMKDNRIKYLASEAFMAAANDIYRQFSQKDLPTFDDLHNAEHQITSLLKSRDWEDHKEYLNSVSEVTSKLYDRLYHIFNERVYWYFDRCKGTKAFKNQPCFVFGGGARLPIPEGFRQVCIHDNGQPACPNLHTYAQRTNIDNYIPIVGILPDDNSWKKDFGLLVVAFGLSFLHNDNETYWDLDEYKAYPHHIDVSPELIPHPFNEDMYIYDILAAKWNKS